MKETIGKPDEQLGFLLMQASMLKQRIVNSALKELELTYMQFVILAGILELGIDYAEITQQTIVTERQLDKAMVSNVIKTLLKKKLITRERHLVDSRAWLLRLTKDGEEIALKGKQTARDIDDTFFASVDKVELRTSLKKLLANNI